MKALVSREPVMTLAVIQSAIALIAAFGIDLSAEQTASLVAFSAAVLGWITRQRVTPTQR